MIDSSQAFPQHFHQKFSSRLLIGTNWKRDQQVVILHDSEKSKDYVNVKILCNTIWLQDFHENWLRRMNYSGVRHYVYDHYRLYHLSHLKSLSLEDILSESSPLLAIVIHKWIFSSELKGSKYHIF